MTWLKRLFYSKKYLIAEIEKLKKDAIGCMVEEFVYNGKDVEATFSKSGVSVILVEFIKALLSSSAAPNFVSMNIEVTDGSRERFYIIAGRCNGMSISEKYNEVCRELRQLKVEVK